MGDNLKESVFKPLKDVGETLGDPKIAKNSKETKGMFASLASGAFGAAKVEQVMKLIDPFVGLIALVAPFFDVLNGLLSALVGEILVILMPYVADFSKALIGLMPIFKEIGRFVATFVIVGFALLMELFKKLMPILKPIGDFLMALFLPLWNGLQAAFKAVKDAWDKSGGAIFGENGLIAAAFNALFNIVRGIVNSFINMINAVVFVINLIPGVALPSIPHLAQGGVTNGPTIAMLGDNESGVEIVEPLEKVNERNDAIIYELQKLNRNMERDRERAERIELFNL